MSRYNQSNGGNDDDYDDDDVTLKLKQYSAIRFDLDGLNEHTHKQYGTSFIVSLNNAQMIDGIALRREDKPDTINVYSASEFFSLDRETGRVYETDSHETELTAEEILEHPRVAGHRTSAGGNHYFFEPVGVALEARDEVVLADGESEVEMTDDGLMFGDATMFLGNKTWVRTFAKKVAARGDRVINDNGEDPTPQSEPDQNPKYSTHDWLTTMEPELRSELGGRTVELWVTEDEIDTADGTQTYTTPNVLDMKTGERVTIDNDTKPAEEEQEAPEPTEDDEPDAPEQDGDGLPDGVPDELKNLLDYMARNGNTGADDIRAIAADEVDDPESVDWNAAAEVADTLA